MQKFFSSVFISFFFALKSQISGTQVRVLSNFSATANLANNWQYFAQVGLQIKFGFRIWPLVIKLQAINKIIFYIFFR